MGSGEGCPFRIYVAGLIIFQNTIRKGIATDHPIEKYLKNEGIKKQEQILLANGKFGNEFTG